MFLFGLNNYSVADPEGVPCSVNLTGKQDNTGEVETTVNRRHTVLRVFKLLKGHNALNLEGDC